MNFTWRLSRTFRGWALSGTRHPLRQSDRLPVYMEALESLKALGVVYPCFCTRREIAKEVAAMSHAPHGPEGDSLSRHLPRAYVI